MLHFQSYIIPVLMVGAALFLPNQAFAEKHEPSGQAKPPVAVAQSPLKKADHAVTKVNVPSKPPQATPGVEKKAAVPAAVNKAQGQAVQRGSKQAVSKKLTAVPKPLPAQANGNGYGHSTLKKQAVKTSAKEKQNRPEKDKTIKQGDYVVVKSRTAPKGPVPVKPGDKKFDRIQPVAQQVHVKEKAPLKAKSPVKEKAPVGKQELPIIDQATNPTQRSNSAGGGMCNDRVSLGLHSNSFLEKWFEWNKDYEINHVQPFLSRYDLKHHQWVNAPPSPPPKTAPLFKTVTRS